MISSDAAHMIHGKIISVKELQSGGNVESDEVIEALIERSLLSCTSIVAYLCFDTTNSKMAYCGVTPFGMLTAFGHG